MFVHWSRLRGFLHKSWMVCVEEVAQTDPPTDLEHIVVHFTSKGAINISWIAETGQVQLGFARIYRYP